ncbi:hybrid sensor histidine kinase/response regulator [Desulfosediminicola flagellatus]|uniref:hybrid sensor histidine kinase/response regulator n=1 Tax=Desulfosediminicola flagellatus TaxID=2569541 RepID=UPI0010AB53AE|nr:response regulator [Desulfosediminicola flagellatus]
MKRTYSLAYPIIILLAFVSLGTIFATYHIGSRALEQSLIVREYEKSKQIRLLVKSIIAEKLDKLLMLSKMLETHRDIIDLLTHDTVSGSQNVSLSEVMERTNLDLVADRVTVTNREGTRIYSSESIHDPAELKNIWGLDEALDGEQIVVTSKTRDNWVVRVLGPITSANEIIGAIILTIRVNTEFADKIGAATHTQISFLELSGAAVGARVPLPAEAKSSLETFLSQWDDSLEQDKVFFFEDSDNECMFMFAPLRITDESFFLVVRSDISSMYSLMHNEKKRMVNSSFILFAIAALIGSIFAYSFTKPLRRLRLKAETLAKRYSAEPITTFEGNEIQTLVKTFDVMVKSVDGHIAKRNQAEIALQESIAKVQEATRAKSVFLANMSHEIRTPMNGVVGMTGLLLESELTPEQLQYALTAKSSADSLLTVINDILDYSKVEAGKLDLDSQDFDLRSTIEDVTDVLAVSAHAKGLELAVMMGNEIPAFVRGDSGRLRQILTNLANNAIKFTQKGEVVIRTSLETEDDTHATVRCSVTDTGIGIPQDRLNGLFQSFSQVDASTTRQYGGTGLGLAISKELIELMAGEIGVLSESGKGSTFWFTVPLEKQSGDQPLKTFMPQDIGTKRIMMVDDNATSRQVIKEHLQSCNCRLEDATDGQQALDKLRQAVRDDDPFDIALLDMHMPQMGGEDLGRRIKSNPDLRQTILVMLTPLGQLVDTSWKKEIGFAAYLTKPLKRKALFDCLAMITEKRVEAKTAPLPTLGLDDPAIKARRSLVHILVAEDNTTNQKVVLTILKKLGYQASAVANGREAVNALKRIPYDLVLMDVQMPEMDGVEATGIIRNSESSIINSKVPIIALTAHAMKGDLEKCINAGMDDYTVKPIDPKTLLKKIEKWTAGREV